MAKKPKTSTRSYTLGLLAPSDADDWFPLWERLFRAHYAVCRGAREFGEFYLNLRGGLAASLADCADEQDVDRRRLLQRGARRLLALGWLSVESVREAEDHRHRVHEIEPGQSLTRPLAEQLLYDILCNYKGITAEAELDEWVTDCVPALIAKIRPDAVVVNRAAAFAEWQKTVGEGGKEMPEQARRILFAMCGDGFVSLTLPEEDAVKQEDEQMDSDVSDVDDTDNEDTSQSKSETEDAAEPSKASRGVFGDLFGGDATEKISREAEKGMFARNVRAMLEGLKAPPTLENIHDFREQLNLPKLDTSQPHKRLQPKSSDSTDEPKCAESCWCHRFPPEVSSTGAPTKVAKRYRKLLVGMGLWPKSDKENGAPRTQAISRFGRRVTVQDEQLRNTHINALDLIEACPTPTVDAEPDTALKSTRVFTPPWAPALAERVAKVTNMPVNDKSFNEFKRLMFALAARRVSQTQTWTKRNETERHKASVREDSARKELEKLDSDGRAQKWLEAYEKKRGEQSGSLAEFRITMRMIGECDAVFKAWQGVNTNDEREREITSIQGKAEKFGDARFYSDLSDDPDAAVIWQRSDGSEILKQWVKLRQAQHDQQQLKIPRFCHPDPFHHPTWCEFGGTSKPKVWYAWKPNTKPSNPEPGGNADGSRRLWLLLPDFNKKQARAVPMRWRCKRLSNDLGGVHNVTEESIPRADRLSKAAASLPLTDENQQRIRYRPAYPFTKDAKGWNARLQLDRGMLQRLEQCWDDKCCGWKDNGKVLRRARWFVTFAPELAVSNGPGRCVHPKLGWKSSPHSELNKKQKREGHAKLILSRLPGLRVLSVDLGHRFAAACAVWEALSTDAMKQEVGTRTIRAGGMGKDDHYCHVETPTDKVIKNGRNKGKPVTRTTIYRRIGADTLPDGKPHPAPWARLDRQFMIKLPGEDKPARAASNSGDSNEVAMVQNLVNELGLVTEDDHVKGRAVDQLMSRAVRILKIALNRHARRAKIAYAVDPETKSIPGMGGSEKTFTPGDSDHINFLTNALFDWHTLASEARWNDKSARDLWNEHIAALDEQWRIPDQAEGDSIDEEWTRQQRRKKDDQRREQLKPIAEKLAKADRSAMHRAWKERWEKDDGKSADHESGRKATGFHAHLRLITDWIMGRRLPGADGNGWRQNVGGLSLTRIATMRSLYQLHKAFAMRAKPDKPRGAPEKGETNAGVAQSILNAMEKMREQRVKQLASRIAASALGLGGHWKQVEKRTEDGKPILDSDGKPQKKRVWVEEPSAKYSPCHAVVIENLTNYRPDELKTRRENRQLMAWSAAKVKKYLTELCQLHGLHLREVPAGYTSQQDSRTGAPGCRCSDIPVAEFVKPHWRVKRAVKNLAKGVQNNATWEERLRAAFEAAKVKRSNPDDSENLEDCRIVELLFKCWDAENEIWMDADGVKWELIKDDAKTRWKVIPGQALCAGKKYDAPAALRVLQKGGDLLVPAPPVQPECALRGDREDGKLSLRRAIQADLNAAANIGLRALLDPDWPGKWWYVPCSSKTYEPIAEKVKGSAVFKKTGGPLPLHKSEDSKKGKRSARIQREIVNMWRDPSTCELHAGSGWRRTEDYWDAIRRQVIKILNGADNSVEIPQIPW